MLEAMQGNFELSAPTAPDPIIPADIPQTKAESHPMGFCIFYTNGA